MSLFEKDKLKARIVEKVDTIIEKSISVSEKIIDSDQKELDHLVQLAKIRDQFRPSLERWVTMAILAFSFLVVSLLIGLRIEETEVEMDLTVSSCTFTSTPQTNQVLAEAFNVADIELWSIHQVTLPADAEKGPETINSSNLKIMPLAGETEHVSETINDDAPGIKPRQTYSQDGVLSIGTLFLNGETRTTIKFLEKSGGYSFRFQNRPVAVKLSGMGPLEFHMDSDSRKESYSIPKLIRITPSSNDITLEITFIDKVAPTFNSNIEVQNLSFFSIDQYASNKTTKVWELSTIEEGAIYFADLKGKKVLLRNSEQIRMDRAEGSISSLKLGPKRLSLRFYGKVSGLRSGPENKFLDLMPTYLEYLKSNYFLQLLWGTTASLFGIILLVFKWIKEIK